MNDSKYYGINDMADLFETSTQTIRRRAKEGVIPRPVTWKMFGECSRKPLVWAKKEVDAKLQELGII